MLCRCCLVWSVLQESWPRPFPPFPAELSHLFFPGSSCHLHQKVNLFLFPISAFITGKWLLWKILIKHRLFPGWTETECYSYSIAWHFALRAGSYTERVCGCARVHLCVARGGEQAVAAAVSVSPSSVPSRDFSGVGCMAGPFVQSMFSPGLAVAPAELPAQPGGREGGRQARVCGR